MRSALHNGIFVLAFCTSIGIIASYPRVPTEGTVGIGIGERTPDGEPRYLPIVDDFDAEETTGSIGLDDPTRLWLDDEQRALVFLGVSNLPDVPDVDMWPVPRLASALPAEVELHDIPLMVSRKIPQLRDYRFVKLNDRILLVAVHSRRVAAAIPRYKLVINP